jgi:hypothetical protein
MNLKYLMGRLVLLPEQENFGIESSLMNDLFILFHSFLNPTFKKSDVHVLSLMKVISKVITNNY